MSLLQQNLPVGEETDFLSICLPVTFHCLCISCYINKVINIAFNRQNTNNTPLPTMYFSTSTNHHPLSPGPRRPHPLRGLGGSRPVPRRRTNPSPACGLGPGGAPHAAAQLRGRGHGLAGAGARRRRRDGLRGEVLRSGALQVGCKVYSKSYYLS